MQEQYKRTIAPVVFCCWFRSIWFLKLYWTTR